MNRKWVYAFTEGDGKNKKLLGGKGANLCEMTQIGLKVPPGFVITTEACLAVVNDPKKKLPAGMMDQVHAQLADVERKSQHVFGGRNNPLLISVRSGSAMSMPGMMDTILNLGLNAETLQGMIARREMNGSVTMPTGALYSSSGRLHSVFRKRSLMPSSRQSSQKPVQSMT